MLPVFYSSIQEPEILNVRRSLSSDLYCSG